MIEEAYVSFETAKLLRDKGFREPTVAYAYSQNMISYYSRPRTIDDMEVESGRYPLPTQQMAMRWLREIHKICIVVYPFTHRERGTYTSDICTTTMTMEEGHLRGVWNTYEEAVEESVKYCLNNLIK